MTARLSRRKALAASVAAGLGLAACSPAKGHAADDALLAQAGVLQDLRAREQSAWDTLTDADPDGGPAHLAASALSADVLHAGEALAEMPATTAGGLAVKALAMLALTDRDTGDLSFACEEHYRLVGSILRDAVRLGPGVLS